MHSVSTGNAGEPGSEDGMWRGAVSTPPYSPSVCAKAAGGGKTFQGNESKSNYLRMPFSQ